MHISFANAPFWAHFFYFSVFGIHMPHASKKNILSALESNDLDAVVSLAAGDRKVLSRLVRLAYDKETLIGWRAIRAVGLVARVRVKSDYEFLRETCRKLLWSLTDESGGIGWSAPEMLGEIVSADPVRFRDIIPLIASAYEVEEDVFLAGVLYSLARIAETAPELAAPYQKIIIMSLADRDPLVRVRGIGLIRLLRPWVQSNGIWSREFCERITLSLDKLKSDSGEAWVYQGDNFTSLQVGDEARKIE
jgi:hypothetical protein